MRLVFALAFKMTARLQRHDAHAQTAGGCAQSVAAEVLLDQLAGAQGNGHAVPRAHQGNAVAMGFAQACGCAREQGRTRLQSAFDELCIPLLLRAAVGHAASAGAADAKNCSPVAVHSMFAPASSPELTTANTSPSPFLKVARKRISPQPRAL